MSLEVNEEQPTMAKKVLGDSFAKTGMEEMRKQMTRQLEAQSKSQNLGAAVENDSQKSEKKK